MAVGGCTYDRPMAFPLPSTLSPSKVSTFKDCALAFRFSAIDKLPEPSSVPAVKGTLVHRALELLFATPPPARTRDAAAEHLAAALDRKSMADLCKCNSMDSTAVNVTMAYLLGSLEPKRQLESRCIIIRKTVVAMKPYFYQLHSRLAHLTILLMVQVMPL